MKGIDSILEKLGIADVNHGVTTGQSGWEGGGALLESFSPVDGRKIGAVTQASRADYDRAVETASLAFKTW